jgi:hypothetical protein
MLFNLDKDEKVRRRSAGDVIHDADNYAGVDLQKVINKAIKHQNDDLPWK